MDKHLLVEHTLKFFLDSDKGFLLLILLLLVIRFHAIFMSRDARVTERYTGAFKVPTCIL